jgi:hypothetical protein
MRFVQHFITATIATTMAIGIGYVIVMLTWAGVAQWATSSLDDNAHVEAVSIALPSPAASCGTERWPAPAASCGTERWPVKTLADPDAARISEHPIAATVAELTAGEAPARSTLPNAARLPAELKTYIVTGYLVGFKREDDSDFHIVIADLSNPRKTMVNEIPAAACMPEEYADQAERLRASWEKRFGKATAKFKDVRRHHIKVQFTGVGFYDFIHGQTGVAHNGFELHPVLAWQDAAAAQPVKGELRSEVDARMKFLPLVDAAFRGTKLLHADSFFLLKPVPAMDAF